MTKTMLRKKSAFKLSTSFANTIIDCARHIRPLPPLDTSSLPAPYITLPETRGAGPSRFRDPDVEAAYKAASSIQAPAAPVPPPELTKDGKKLTKKELKKVRRAMFYASVYLTDSDSR